MNTEYYIYGVAALGSVVYIYNLILISKQKRRWKNLLYAQQAASQHKSTAQANTQKSNSTWQEIIRIPKWKWNFANQQATKTRYNAPSEHTSQTKILNDKHVLITFITVATLLLTRVEYMLPTLPFEIPLLKYHNYKDFLYWFSKAAAISSLVLIAWLFTTSGISRSFKRTILSIYFIYAAGELIISLPFWVDQDLDQAHFYAIILLPVFWLLSSKTSQYFSNNYQQKYLQSQELLDEITQNIQDLSENQCKNLSLAVDNLFNLPDYLTQPEEFELLRGETKEYSQEGLRLLAQIELKFKILTLKTSTHGRN